MLYDLTADPGERRNLADQRPDVTSRLGRRLDDWRIDCADLNDRLTESSVADIDTGTAAQLKQLGYVE
jgi:hypothetical protein